jgi:hypothetical protein
VTIHAHINYRPHSLLVCSTRCPESNDLCFFCSKYLLKIMKIRHIQVTRFVSKPYFSSLRPLLRPCANEKQARVCPVGRYPSLSCPCSQVITPPVTSSSVLNFTPRAAFLVLRSGENLKVLRRGCRVDGVTLSNQILLCLPGSSDLYAVLVGGLYNSVQTSKVNHLKSHVPSLVTGRENKF